MSFGNVSGGAMTSRVGDYLMKYIGIRGMMRYDGGGIRVLLIGKVFCITRGQ